MRARTRPDLEPIIPEWPRSARIRAAFTTRHGGVSEGPYASLNVGAHVGDAPEAVAENRRRVRTALRLPREPAWLRQVHGTQVLELAAGAGEGACADASISRVPQTVCCIQVADCLPVLLASDSGSVAGAAHAGWRGLAAGVLEATVRAMDVPPQELSAWLGPAIGPEAFEVGGEVRDAFMQHDPHAEEAFSANAAGRWQCDLYRLARQRLNREGVSRLYGGGYCTFGEPERFFSYRREGQNPGQPPTPCGRMAALIWIEP